MRPYRGVGLLLSSEMMGSMLNESKRSSVAHRILQLLDEGIDWGSKMHTTEKEKA